jgi:hypothetical protein
VRRNIIILGSRHLLILSAAVLFIGASLGAASPLLLQVSDCRVSQNRWHWRMHCSRQQEP